MWSGTPKLVFVALLAINGVLWSHSRYAQFGTRSSLLTPGLSKRSFDDASQLSGLLIANEVRTLTGLAVSCSSPTSR